MTNTLTNIALKYNNIITISGLTKKYGHKVVLADVNFQINRGDSIAFVGRNGCGKSTFLKIIAGVLPFDKGKIKHNGNLKFGYVPERFPVMNLTVGNYINQIGAIAGLGKEDLKKRSMQLFEALFMSNMIETPIRYLSKGTIQKVAVVQAFLTKPDILILDEPVSGQDMASQSVFIEMVNNLVLEHGVTIISSCHEDYMIKEIAQSVYEIANGQLHAVEQPQKFNNDNLYRLLFTFNKKNESLIIPHKVSNKTVKLERLEGGEVIVYVTASEIDTVLSEMLMNGFKLKGLNNERII